MIITKKLKGKEMLYEIKHKISGKLKFSIETTSWKLAIEAAIKTKADLRYADLRSADLRYADLRSTDLRSADLRYANLSSANLRSADLRSANLSSADLRSANLRSANLRSADLSSANLRSADLRYADLRSADLSSANLRSADLRSADLRYADLRSADLDLSCWPLACKSFGVKCDNRLVFQLSMHICKLDCKTKEFTAIKKALKKYANRFHRVGQDVDKIK